jgi:hypothetical protein
MESSYKDVLFFLGLGLFGVVLYNVRLNFSKASEERRKDDDWFSELLFGGPGYYRAVFTLNGIVFTIVGVVGSLWLIFNLIADN